MGAVVVVIDMGFYIWGFIIISINISISALIVITTSGPVPSSSLGKIFSWLIALLIGFIAWLPFIMVSSLGSPENIGL